MKTIAITLLLVQHALFSSSCFPFFSLQTKQEKQERMKALESLSYRTAYQQGDWKAIKEKMKAGHDIHAFELFKEESTHEQDFKIKRKTMWVEKPGTILMDIRFKDDKPGLETLLTYGEVDFLRPFMVTYSVRYTGRYCFEGALQYSEIERGCKHELVPLQSTWICKEAYDIILKHMSHHIKLPNDMSQLITEYLVTYIPKPALGD